MEADERISSLLQAIYNEEENLETLISSIAECLNNPNATKDMFSTLLTALAERLEHYQFYTLPSSSTESFSKLLKLLEFATEESENALVEVLKSLGNTHVSTNNVVDMWKILKSPWSSKNARTQVFHIIEELSAGKDVPRSVFDFHGAHSGIILPNSLPFPSKAYSMLMSLRVSSGNQIVPIYSFRGKKGHGVSCVIENNTMFVRTHEGQGTASVVSLQFHKFMDAMTNGGKWINLAVIHSKSIVFKDKVRIYANGKLLLEANLVYPDARAIVEGHNCVGTGPGYQSMQGEVYNPTLFSTALSAEDTMVYIWTSSRKAIPDPDKKLAASTSKQSFQHVTFAFDARFVEKSTAMAYDTSGHGCHGFLDPGTTPITSSSFSQAIGALGGPVIFPLFLLPLVSGSSSLSPVPEFTSVEIATLFRTLAATLDNDALLRLHFVNCSGLEICCHVLVNLAPESLSLNLLVAVTKLVNSFYHDVDRSNFSQALCLLLYNMQIWSRGSVEVQLELLGQVLPEYLHFDLKISDSSWKKYCWRLSIPFLCYVMSSFYDNERDDNHHRRFNGDGCCCEAIITKLITPISCLNSRDNVIKPLQQILYHIHTRCDELNNSTSSLGGGRDVRYLIELITTTLIISNAVDGEDDTKKVSGILKNKLSCLGGLALWWKPLSCRMRGIRNATLRLMFAWNRSMKLSYAQVFMMYSCLKANPLESDTLESVLSEFRNDRSANLVIILLGLLPTEAPSIRYACITEIALQLKIRRREVAENIRSWSPWIKCVLSLVREEGRGEDTYCAEDDDKVKSLTSAFFSEESTLTSKQDVAEQLAALNNSGAYKALLGFWGKTTNSSLKTKCLNLIFKYYPINAATIIHDMATDVMVDLLSYAFTEVRHGWIYFLELKFYLQCPDIFSTIVSKTLKRFYNLVESFPTEISGDSILWGNASQVASLSTYSCLFKSSLPTLSEAQRKIVLQQTVRLWCFVAPKLQTDIDWDKMEMSLGSKTSPLILQELFSHKRECLLFSIHTTTSFLQMSPTDKDLVTGLRHLLAEYHFISVPSTVESYYGKLESILGHRHPLYLYHIWILEQCYIILKTTTTVNSCCEIKKSLVQLMVEIATEALILIDPESTEAQAVLCIASTDTSIQEGLPKILEKWDTSVQELITIGASATIAEELHLLVQAFELKWKSVENESSSGLNTVMIERDAKVRSAILSSEHQRVDEVLYWMHNNAISIPSDMFFVNYAHFTKLAERQKKQLQNLLNLQNESDKNGCYKLEAKENSLRMRILMKWSTKKPPLWMNNSTAEAIVSNSPISSSSPLSKSWSRDSNGGDEVGVFLEDATIRAAVIAGSKDFPEHDNRKEYDQSDDDEEDEDDGNSNGAITTEMIQDYATADDDNPHLVSNALKSIGKAALRASNDHDAEERRPNELHRKGSLRNFHETYYSCKCEHIRSMNIVSGTLYVMDKFVIFTGNRLVDEQGNDVSLGNTNSNVLKERVWKVHDIEALHRRRFLLRPTAFEMFIRSTSKAYLFNVPSKLDSIEIHKWIMYQKPVLMYRNPVFRRLRNGCNAFKSSKVSEKWQNYEISTFEYLMTLNTLAGRTYNDLTQYPVFPWVISDYESSSLNLGNKSVFRDLSKPIGALEHTRSEQYIQRYKSLEHSEIPPFMYGSHYSHIGAVLYYLVRLEPYSSFAIRLQGGKFDHADRLFHSITDTWNNVLTDFSDVKELTPEWFYLPQMLKNLNKLDLGMRQDGQVVSDVQLPPWAESAEDFVYKNRLALESEYVSQNLHRWIDLIFGSKQRGLESVKAKNVFFHLTYEGNVDLDALSHDPVLHSSLTAQVAYFGQTPTQLLFTSHPPRQVRASDKAIFNSKQILESRHSSKIIAMGYDTKTQLLTSMDVTGKYFTYSLVFKDELPQSGSIPMISSKNVMDDGCKNVVILAETKFAIVGGHHEGFATSHNLSSSSASRKQNDSHAIQHHLSQVSCVKLSEPIGTRLALGCVDGSISIWTVFQKDEGGVFAQALQALLNKNARAVTKPNFHADVELLGHRTKIRCMSINEELNICVSGGASNTCLMHEVITGSLIRTFDLESHNVQTSSITITPTGYVVIEALNNENASCLKSFHTNGSCVSSIDLPAKLTGLRSLYKSMSIITSSADLIELRCPHTLRVLQSVSDFSATISCHTVTRDEKKLIIGLTNGSVLVLL